MKKLAVFVEGQTEQEFVAALIGEIAGQQNLQIDLQKSHDKRGQRYIAKQYVQTDAPSVRYYVLVVDCGGDETVTSDVCEQYQSLVTKGYCKIIGLRDVRPRVERRQIRGLEAATGRAIEKLVGASPDIPVDVLLSIMEIEAWFIAEDTHFPRIKRGLTCEVIKKRLGINPAEDDVEKLNSPSKTLNQIYEISGAKYKKKKGNVQRTVWKLDYDYLCLEVSQRVPRLRILVDHLWKFFSIEK